MSVVLDKGGGCGPKAGWRGRTGRPSSGTRRAGSPPPGLLADSEPLDQPVVAVGRFSLQVIEQPPSAGDELQKAPAGMMVLGVALEMVRQVADPVGQKGDLDLRRSGVLVMGPKLPNDVG